MPYSSEHVDPDVAVEHKGVTIYNTYRDDDVAMGAHDYWYSTSSSEGECSGYAFDVRCLPGYREGRKHEDVIMAAIDAGLLLSEEPVNKAFR